MTNSALAQRRLWVTAGCLAIGYIVLTFAGVVFQYTLQLGQSRQEGVKQLVQTSLSRNYVGGYLEYLAVLVFLVGALLFARLLRGDTETSGWLSSCISGSAVGYVAVTVAGSAVGAAALYGAHHGASLSTATTVNNIRNFAFFLSGGLLGVVTISLGAAGRATGLLPRWVCYSGMVVGAFAILAIPGSRIGLQNVTVMTWFAWVLVLGVTALRTGRSRATQSVAMPATA